MSDLGPLTYGKKEQEVFLGREIGAGARLLRRHGASRSMRLCGGLSMRRTSRRTQILEENRDIMHRMAAALLERETLDAAEIELLIAGQAAGAGEVAAGLGWR